MHGRCSRRTSTPSDSSWSASARPVPSSSSSSSGMVGVSGWVGSTLSSGGCQWAMHGCGDVLLPSLDVLGGWGERDSVLLDSLLTVWAVAAPASAALRPAHRGEAACSVPRAASWGEGGSAAITTSATTNGNSNYTDYTKFLIPAPRN